MESMNIYQRMAAVTRDLQTVAKNLTVETARGKGYKAVSERDIIDAVKPLEDKYGIYSYPCAREIIESATLESSNTYDGKTTTKTTFFTRIKTLYRFVNIDKPSEIVDTVTFAEGIDTQDKGSGKAMTYADKYALMKAYKISTGDDPDQNASEDEHYTQRGKQETKKPAPTDKISEETANRIIKGLAFACGEKTDDQRLLLENVSEGKYSNVYDIAVGDAQKIYDDLVALARQLKADKEQSNEG